MVKQIAEYAKISSKKIAVYNRYRTTNEYYKKSNPGNKIK